MFKNEKMKEKAQESESMALGTEEKDMAVTVKKIVLEIAKEIEADEEGYAEIEMEEIQHLIFEKTLVVLQRDPKHIDAVTTFGNEELEKLELN